MFIVKELKQKLLRYAAEQGIKNGMIFVTRTGKPISRANIWREMKSLCVEANVNPQKGFPHNLRHLFARVFYGIEKDIAKLADILGHSSINTTRIYIISTGTEHRRRMENMHLILWKKPPIRRWIQNHYYVAVPATKSLSFGRTAWKMSMQKQAFSKCAKMQAEKAGFVMSFWEIISDFSFFFQIRFFTPLHYWDIIWKEVPIAHVLKMQHTT